VETREDAVLCYIPWLNEKLKYDNEVKREFDRLVEIYRKTGELVLICYCAPKACHGSHIKKMIEDLILSGRTNV